MFSSQNQMTAQNLALVLVPTLFQDHHGDLVRLTRDIIIHHSLLFLVHTHTHTHTQTQTHTHTHTHDNTHVHAHTHMQTVCVYDILHYYFQTPEKDEEEEEITAF